MENLEIEIKFHLENPGLTRSAITDLGGVSQGRVFESNHILDNREAVLLRNHALLRLRQDDQACLTFKSPPPSPDSQFKIRREIEVGVSDFTTTRKILEALGFTTVRIYEKRREMFELGAAHLCLDTLPYGDFLEIEGAPQNIVDLSAKLGLPWEQRSVLNYHELFELVKTDLGLTFTDITFSNFEGLAVDMRRLKDRFEAGA